MFHDEIARYLISKGAPTAGQVCEKWVTRGYSAVHLASRKQSQIDILRSLLLKDLQSGSPCFRSPVHPTHIAVACGNNVGLGAIIQHVRSQIGAPEPSAICASTLDTTYYGSGKGLHGHKASLRLSSKVSGRKGIRQRQPASPLLDAQISMTDLQWVWQLSQGTSKKAKPLTTKHVHTGTALHVAAVVDNMAATTLLLENGANPNCAHGKSSTPLHIACEYGHLRIIDLLLQFGSNPNAQDNCGQTPAMLAASQGHLTTLELLRQHHADLSTHDIDRRSTLSHAVKGGPAVFSCLLTLGCDPYSLDINDFTPLLKACRLSRHYEDFGALLCNSGLHFAHHSSQWGGLLHFQPFIDGTISTLRLFLARIPKEIVARDINLRGGFVSPLYRAAVRGAIGVLGLLIRSGGNLEIEGGEQGTPLMAACVTGRLPAVKYLVRAGAKMVYTKDGKFVTAVRAARYFPLVIRWLLAEQYTEQFKIELLPAETSKDHQIRNWSGPMTVKVPTLGLYSPKHGASSFDLAVQLHKLRRDLAGKVVVCI
jgi:ankyrin repeat protein